MRLRQWRLARLALIGILTFPLLGTGACLQIAQDALINGFFDVANARLVDWLKSELSSDTGESLTDESDES